MDNKLAVIGSELPVLQAKVNSVPRKSFSMK
ncbi:hypothetical protein LKACC16343_02719 [Companilactobacillus bobalius]|uniref:Uncharacterized protein n=1 Tax=Companilactobacillus bobalius TaxID=2801451 RepID=A0A202F405_9LACO|nr:hypothetical protein LKACC16343_02719 [Companilactobacillus bobalius]